jgi:hypothetical protein
MLLRRKRAAHPLQKRGVGIPTPWGNMSMFSCSFEDMEAMISTLLVISALIISFMVAMMLGIQRSDLVAGDMLWIDYLNMTSKPWLLTIDSGGIWHTTVNPYKWDWNNGGFVSHDIANKCVNTVGQLTTVIFVLTGSYFSLHMSQARGDTQLFERWLIVGLVMVGGSSILFFAAFFEGTSAIGNAMGILYPAIRWHDSYKDLLEEVKTGYHFGGKNFVVEPMAQKTLSNYAACGLSIGLVGGCLAIFVASWSWGQKDEEMSSFLDSLGLDARDIDEHARTFSRERLSVRQIKCLSLEQLAWIGIPCGDALKMLEGVQNIPDDNPEMQKHDAPSPSPTDGISIERSV